MCKPEEEQSLLGAQVGGVEVEAEEKKNEGGKEDQNRGVEVKVVEVEEEVNEDCCTKSWLVVLASCLCICMLDGSMYSNGVYTKTLVKVNLVSASFVYLSIVNLSTLCHEECHGNISHSNLNLTHYRWELQQKLVHLNLSFQVHYHCHVITSPDMSLPFNQQFSARLCLGPLY